MRRGEFVAGCGRDVPVRQEAFQDAGDTLHILDVVTNQGGGADTVFVAVANPERTRNGFFLTRTDGSLRRAAASYEKQPATVVPNTDHSDLSAQEIQYWKERLPYE